MTISALVGLLLGMLLAQRFTVLILIPVMLVSIILLVSIGLGRGEQLWMVAAATTLTVIALQIGYLIGMAVHHLVVLARASRLHSSSLNNPLQRRREAQWPSTRLIERL
jgi:hypothetical protein